MKSAKVINYRTNEEMNVKVGETYIDGHYGIITIYGLENDYDGRYVRFTTIDGTKHFYHAPSNRKMGTTIIIKIS